MSEIDKMVCELLPDELCRFGYEVNGLSTVVSFSAARDAIRTALLTAPPGWKLVPIPPTDDMIDAAEDAHMPFGDMHFAITSAILAAPEPK